MTVNNTLSSVIPTLYAMGLTALRRNCVMPRLVLNDYSDEVKQKGEIIQIPLPSTLTTANVAPAAYAPDPQNIAPTTATIPLDYWQESAFTLSEKELAQVVNGVVPIQLSSAAEAIADAINQTIFGLHVNVPNIVGTAGTTPFGSDVTAATLAATVLTNQLAPVTDRKLVLNPTAYGTALALPAFNAWYSSHDEAIQRDGVLRNRFGFDWAQDQRVPTHTSGTITTGLTAKAATPQAAGLSAIVAHTAASTGACALLTGDIMTFSGDAQTYTLTANATQATANSDVTLNIFPPKAVALSGGETITVTPSHVVNLAFHRQAFAFASRPLASSKVAELIGMNVPEMEFMVPDPVSGITMKLCVRPEYKRIRWSFEALWGVGVVRPLLAARVLG